MNQIWNIFRKDARHHCPEIAISIAVLASYAWKDSYDWNHPDAMAYGVSALFAFRFLSGLVTVLLPVSWVFLITRVIQGESLVGDRQFWVTRPYDRRMLAAAKVVFLITFINVPLLTMQLILLAKAGFHPIAYLSRLLWNQCLWILLIFLAVAALAAVTASLAQMLLALFLIVLYMIGMAALAEVIPSSGFSSSSDSWSIVLIITGLAVVLLQYFKRRTTSSRWLIVSFCALSTLLLVATPYRKLVAREYPAADNRSSIGFSLLPSHPPDGDDASYLQDMVAMQFPFSVAGIPIESFLQVNGIIITLTNTAGVRWDSDWQGQNTLVFLGQKSPSINIQLKKTVFDQFKAGPIKAHILVAFTLYADRDRRQLVVPINEFEFPDIGLCASYSAPYWHQLRCRVPPRKPTLVLISSAVDQNTCPPSNAVNPPSPGSVGRSLVQEGDFGPPLSPVRITSLSLETWDRTGYRYSYPEICPGTPLILSHPEVIARNRMELDFENLSLGDYREGPRKIFIH